jgi:hypothetical protein
MEKLAAEIERSQRERRDGTTPTWGGARPPEAAGTVRLEPYVDFGLIGKPERSRYTYTLNDRQRAFYRALVDTDDISTLLDTKLVGLYLRSQGRDLERCGDEAIWEAVLNAYRLLRSRLGYAAFREVVLLAIGTLVDSGGEGYFEIADGIEVIRREKERSPRADRYGVSRGGGLTYVKIGRGTST